MLTRGYFLRFATVVILILFSSLIIGIIIAKFLDIFSWEDGPESHLAPFRGERVVHLDLKGAPPSIDYLKSIFPLFHELGVTSLLIEFEDIFPYSSKYTTAVNAYSMKNITTLLKMAKKNQLNVIPLVQTFGHVEFLLKMRKFSHLREEFKHPQSICPSHNETMSIITGLLDEVIKAHPLIRYIHIGGDEVYQLGLCEKCVEKMAIKHWDSDELFLDHITHVAKYVRSKYPHIIPLMWDDQLRSISANKLKYFDIGTLIEPVVWFYQPVISLASDMWMKYAEIFPSIWVASSFKGATGADKIITNISYHVQNQISWMHVMANYGNSIHFKGVIITGWQRYDHFAVLCELLPVSIPSLVHVGLILDGSRSIRMNTSQTIENVKACGEKNEFSESCKFPGVDIYEAVLKFSQLKIHIDKFFERSYVKGYFSAYNIKTKYVSSLLVEELTSGIGQDQMALQSTEINLRNTLKTVYDKYTVSEWIETNVRPYTFRLNNFSAILKNLSTITEWGSRYEDLILNFTT